MAELVLQSIGSRGKQEQAVLHAARAAAVALAQIGRAVLRAADFTLRLSSASMQANVSGRGWTGLPGNPSPGAWLGTNGTSGARGSVARR